MKAKQTLTPIEKRHDRKKFKSKNLELNSFLRTNARQSSDKRMTRTYVLESPDDEDTIVGYVTLTPTSIEIPEDCPPGKGLQNPAPALLLARMAVDEAFVGQGWGKKLLIFAIIKAAETSDSVGGVGLVIDAKDQEAKAFYESQAGEDIEVIDESGLKLWIPNDICQYIAGLQED